MRVVVESPMKGKDYADLHRNLRYAAWCCRAEVEAGNDPIASHLFCTLFLNDRVTEERKIGMLNQHFWEEGVPHHIYNDIDISESDGTNKAANSCVDLHIPYTFKKLPPHMLERFKCGEWPPHTVRIANVSGRLNTAIGQDEVSRRVAAVRYKLSNDTMTPSEWTRVSAALDDVLNWQE